MITFLYTYTYIQSLLFIKIDFYCCTSSFHYSVFLLRHSFSRLKEKKSWEESFCGIAFAFPRKPFALCKSALASRGPCEEMETSAASQLAALIFIHLRRRRSRPRGLNEGRPKTVLSLFSVTAAHFPVFFFLLLFFFNSSSAHKKS